MSSLNRVQLIGNLGKDPELRQTSGGTAVCSFSVACNDKYKDKDGDWKERVEWVNVVTWAQLAELVDRYCKKGKQVYVEGRLSTRKWTDKTGTDRYTTEVVADKVLFLGSGGGDNKREERRDDRQGDDRGRRDDRDAMGSSGGGRRDERDDRSTMGRRDEAPPGNGGGAGDDGYDPDSEMPFVVSARPRMDRVDI